MTVKEMFEAKYKERMATIDKRTWEYAVRWANDNGKPVHEIVMMSIEVTQLDLKRWGVSYYGTELERLHKAKCIASNRHRQEHGHVDRYWLTDKGYKQLGF